MVGGDALEGAGAGRSDDEAAGGGGAGVVDGVECLGGDADVFGVHGVLVERFGVDWFEGAGADVEGDGVDAGAARAEGVEEFGGEVEPGGGGGDGAGALGVGVDGLVAACVVVGVVGFVAGAPGLEDVGGEWDGAEAGEGVGRAVGGLEADGPFAGVVFFEEVEGGSWFSFGLGFRVGGSEEFEALVWSEFAVGFEEDAPEGGVVGVGAQVETFDFAGGVGSACAEACAEDERVVEGDGVVGGDVVREVADGAVFWVVGVVAADDEEARVLAALWRAGGDEVGGEVVVEFVGAHVAVGRRGCVAWGRHRRAAACGVGGWVWTLGDVIGAGRVAPRVHVCGYGIGLARFCGAAVLGAAPGGAQVLGVPDRAGVGASSGDG